MMGAAFTLGVLLSAPYAVWRWVRPDPVTGEKSAIEVPSAEASHGSGGAQSLLREECRYSAIGGQGVQPSGPSKEIAQPVRLAAVPRGAHAAAHKAHHPKGNR